MLQEKMEQMKTMEDELNKIQEIKPQLEELKKTSETLQSDKEDLIREKEASEEKNKDLEEKLNATNKEKDEVLFMEAILYQKKACYSCTILSRIIRGSPPPDSTCA